LVFRLTFGRFWKSYLGQACQQAKGRPDFGWWSFGLRVPVPGRIEGSAVQDHRALFWKLLPFLLKPAF